MSLLQIVYCSINRITGTPEEVDAEITNILNLSRENNSRAQVTGALLFNGHAFAQVLEGPSLAVEQIYERIRSDQRHSNVMLVSSVAAPERIFSDWSMAYADPAAVRAHASGPIDLDEVLAQGEHGGARVVEALRQLVSA